MTFDWSKIRWIRKCGPGVNYRFSFLSEHFAADQRMWSGSHVVEVTPEGWVVIWRDCGGGAEAILNPVDGKRWLDEAMERCAESLWKLNPEGIAAIGIQGGAQ